jgi:hypothetical protein
MKYKVNYNYNKQKGGSYYYLPCEITHYTSHVYYSNTNISSDKISKKIGMSSGNISWNYYQDVYVQLYDGENYKNIITNDMFNNISNKKSISICNHDECICRNKKIKEPKIYYKNDEILVKFPWLCEPLPTSIITNIINPEFTNDIFIKINPTDTRNSTIEQLKGGNYISAPDNIIFYINGTNIIIEEINKINNNLNCIELNCSFKANDFRHLDELMCFMPYGKNKYKVWFYDEFNETHFDNIHNIYSKRYVDIINKERLENLNKISNALFCLPYNKCVDNFVFFNFYLWTQSILNRTWYETPEKCICLFPILSISLDLKLDLSLTLCLLRDLNQKVHNEMEKVYSCIDNKKPTYDFIKVSDVDLEKPNGTLHCLIKQRFEKV